jgi:dihydrolipoamide dehydrogenase
MNYDLIIIGSGPGGYVAAIRASQLGLKTAVVEKSKLGGVCLNWGCIPTKSLLKSAQTFNSIIHANEYGIDIEGTVKPNIAKMVERSRGVADNMSKGIEYLFKKNKIDTINGVGKLKSKDTIIVKDNSGNETEYTANHIILATGASSRELPNLPQDGVKIIGYKNALILNKQPESMVIVGSGAIGSEFAYFYSSIGTKVTLIEYLPNIVPNEDIDVSKQLGRSFKKAKMKIMVNSSVENVDTTGEKCKVTVKTKNGEEIIEADIVLSAVGITPNISNLGLEDIGIETENGKIKVDEFYKTNIANIYAIGDIINTPALAHVASAEGITCVEKIAGHNTQTIDYNNIPGCTYTIPEISSFGITEKKAEELGLDIKIGKFPFTASGKANALGSRDGFAKLIFDKKTDKLIGAHLIGANVTEIISELIISKKLNATNIDIIKTIHPHPTMSEAVMEAAADANNEVIHI